MALVTSPQVIQQSMSQSRQTISQYEIRLTTARQRLSEDPANLKLKLQVWFFEAEILQTKKWLSELQREEESLL